jgi:tetratricopeptide (TPR) repeat protein
LGKIQRVSLEAYRYNWIMRTGEKIASGIKVLLPLLLAVLLGLAPQSSAVNEALQAAWVAEVNQRAEAAADQLQLAVAYLPWRADLWERIGQQRMLAEQNVQAAEAFQKAWMLDGISEAGLEQLAQVHLALQEDAGAAAAWQERIGRGKAEAQVYADLAAAQRRMDNLNGAVATLREWQAQYPEDARAAYLLGAHLLLVSPPEAAEPLAQAAQTGGAYAEKSTILQAGIKEAQDELDPVYRTMLLGRKLAQAGEWQLAGIAFAQVTALAPDYAEGWAMLGEALQQQGQDGKPALEKAQALAPDSVLVRSLWGLYWRRQGKPEIALVIYNKLAAEEPQQAVWQAEIGHALNGMGDILSALPYYQKAAALAEDDPLYWQALARFCIENGIEARETGLPAARKALALQPDDPAALDLMGWTMMYFQDLPSAERFLQQAIQHDAAFALAHLHLGQLYLQTGEFSLAKTHLLQAVSLDQQGFIGQMAQRSLDGLN